MNWESLKNKMGLNYGSLKEESTIDVDNLAGAVTAKSKFDHAVSQVVTSLLLQLIIPWIEYCFRKYDEKHFHTQMSNGFDFIADWKDNHPDRYTIILNAIRRVRNRIILNEDKILQVVLNELKKRGWIVTEWEKGRFRENISTLIKEIYT